MRPKRPLRPKCPYYKKYIFNLIYITNYELIEVIFLVCDEMDVLDVLDAVIRAKASVTVTSISGKKYVDFWVSLCYNSFTEVNVCYAGG